MSSLPMQFYNTDLIRTAERIAIEDHKISDYMLMERAGFAAFECLTTHFPHLENIAVFCGKGNNAGDGFVLARLAFEAHLQVEVYSLCGIEALPSAAQQAARACSARGIDIQPFRSDLSIQADVCVDALLGTGLRGEVQEPVLSAIEWLNRHEVSVFSLDVPSGLNADTGSVHGPTVIAEHTVTFIGLKQGMLTGIAADYTGQISVASLGLDDILQKLPVSGYRLSYHDVEAAMIPRLRSGHKGLYGTVLIVGGDYGMAGAVRLAAEAAYRVGSGLVKVATRPEHLSAVISQRPEIMAYPVQTPDDLMPLIESATCIAIGPGLGESAWSQAMLQKILASDKPLVVDASALNLLAKQPQKRQNWILTPHPGEAGRLLSKTNTEIQVDRFAAIEALQQRYGGVIVLKGAGTMVKADKELLEICYAGNPGMATGGMGDVLTGVIASLWGQGLSAFDATRLGVILHATAGDHAAEKSGERGMMAMDLMPVLRILVNPSTMITVEEADQLMQTMLLNEYQEIDSGR